MPFQWFTQAILLQKKWREEKCCNELIAQQKILMEGKERKAKPEPGICPAEYTSKKFVGRYFLWIIWQIIFGLWKACLTATLGRAAREPGDESRETLPLKPGLMVTRHAEPFRANARKRNRAARWALHPRCDWQLHRAPFSPSTLLSPRLKHHLRDSSLSISSKVKTTLMQVCNSRICINYSKTNKKSF